MYDGAAINAYWGHAWPTDVTNVRDTDHEFSPVLMAPVANLLGRPWYLESGSPGGDYAIWLDARHGGRVAVTPHRGRDGLMRWVIGVADSSGNPLQTEHDLLIDVPPEVVAERVRALLAEWGISPAGGQ